jgi:hypothetical protein
MESWKCVVRRPLRLVDHQADAAAGSVWSKTDARASPHLHL